MAFDLTLAHRVRNVLADRGGITERKMFGGLAFLVDGKMFIGIRNTSLMARVGVERHEDALAMPHVRVMDFTGRPMKGYVYIDPPAIAQDKDLQAWVNWCVQYVGRLPQKEQKDERKTKFSAPSDASASTLISQKIAALGDWRGKTLSRMRQLIREADPEVIEELKWMGTPVWSHDGIICTGESYKAVVKLTFAKGASLKDPAGLFNASLDGNVRRAIDIREGDEVDETAFKELIRQAVDFNGAAKAKQKKRTKS